MSGVFICICLSPARTGVLSPSRAVNWANAGVVGGIPARTTQCGSTIAAYSGTAATINSAIASCAAGDYVSLGAGTFNLSTGIDFASHSNVTLRGQGANSTFIVFTGDAACNGVGASVCIEGSNSYSGGPQNTASWTAGYTQGSTSITLSSTANLVANQSYIVLTQADETSDTGNIWNCLVTNVCSNGGSGGWASFGATSGDWSQQQVVEVTGISGNTVTISPGLYMPNWRSGQTPGAWWASTTIQNSGIENLSIDNTNNGDHIAIELDNAANCWVSGVRSLYAGRSHVQLQDVSHATVQNSYFYQSQSHATVSYGVEYTVASDSLVQNNIFQQVTDSEPSNTGGSEGNVSAYNFDVNSIYTAAGWMQASTYEHASGNAFDLWEGNIATGHTADQIHGTHHFETLFRNRFRGWQQSCDGSACTAQTIAIQLYSGSRYFNVVGNVLGQTGYHTNYNCNAQSTASCSSAETSVYVLGYTGNGGGTSSSLSGYCTSPSCSSTSYYDPQVGNYLFRWGNYDVVNGSASGTPAKFLPDWLPMPTRCPHRTPCPLRCISVASLPGGRQSRGLRLGRM